jgi:hypothetical protein
MMSDSTSDIMLSFVKTIMLKAGWPDWAIFHQLGYFWMPIVTFWKDELAQINDDIFGFFLQNFYF